MAAVGELYAAARWEIPEDFLERTHFERVVLTKLDWTSSPGYPYLLRATNNGLFFKKSEDGPPCPLIMEQVWTEVQCRLEGRNPPDHIRLFVKAEAHSAKKLASERYRLISSVSVVDQIIDHMLFDDMNDLMIDNWYQLPSKAGWSCFGGGWRFMPSGKETWMATDASAWDWTVRPWLIDLTLQLRKDLCRNMNPRWLECAERRYMQLFANPTFITSGGLVLRQLNPGVMKSGCVNTIADNSMMQAILHSRVCIEMGQVVTPLFSMGDDRLQEVPDNRNVYIGKTAEFCNLKSVALVNEFAGFRFEGRRVEPVHKGKHAFNLLHMNPKYECETANSYIMNYHRSRFAGWFEGMFNQMGIELFDRGFRDLVFDG